MCVALQRTSERQLARKSGMHAMATAAFDDASHAGSTQPHAIQTVGERPKRCSKPAAHLESTSHRGALASCED